MYEFEKLTETIIGCAMNVHNTLGNGYLEIVYQRCLAIELHKAGLAFVRENEMPIFYNWFVDQFWLYQSGIQKNASPYKNQANHVNQG